MTAFLQMVRSARALRDKSVSCLNLLRAFYLLRWKVHKDRSGCAAWRASWRSALTWLFIEMHKTHVSFYETCHKHLGHLTDFCCCKVARLCCDTLWLTCDWDLVYQSSQRCSTHPLCVNRHHTVRSKPVLFLLKDMHCSAMTDWCVSFSSDPESVLNDSLVV